MSSEIIFDRTVSILLLIVNEQEDRNKINSLRKKFERLSKDDKDEFMIKQYKFLEEMWMKYGHSEL